MLEASPADLPKLAGFRVGRAEVTDDLLTSGMPIRQLPIECHRSFPSIGSPKPLAAKQTLAAAGFHIFHISKRGLEFSFLRTAQPAARHCESPRYGS